MVAEPHDTVSSNASGADALQPVLRRVATLTGGRRRARFRLALRACGFPLACALALTALTVSPLAWLSVPGALLTAALLAAVTVIGAGVHALLRPLDKVAIAKRYDDAAGTKDLLSSALGVREGRADRSDAAFVAAIREDAAAAAGREVAVGFEAGKAPLLRFSPLPLVAAAVVVLIAWLVDPNSGGSEAPVTVDDSVVLADAARLEQLLEAMGDKALEQLDAESLARLQKLAEELQMKELTKREALAEVARLASQLDRERQELQNRELQMKEQASRLAKGEDLQDAQRDMDAGRYREAANKVRKKVEELKKQLEEALQKNDGKVDIEKLRKRLKKMQELLAQLEQLAGLGGELGFTLDVLNVLDRLDGRLGQLREFDGEMFDEVELGRAPRQAGQQPPDGQPRKLLAAPSNDAGQGHAKNALGAPRRALTEGKEREAQMVEGKGKSSFGQVRTANDGSRSRTAYEEAVLAAKRAAEDAIYRQDVPPSYARYLRDYFERLQPDEAPSAPGSGAGDSAGGEGR